MFAESVYTTIFVYKEQNLSTYIAYSRDNFYELVKEGRGVTKLLIAEHALLYR